MRPNLDELLAAAQRAYFAIDERHFTTEALERQIKGDSATIYDLVEYVRLLERIAHAAWHLLDDSGELDTADDNGVPDYMVSGLDHASLSTMLDELEATGWDAHPDAPTQSGSTQP